MLSEIKYTMLSSVIFSNELNSMKKSVFLSKIHFLFITKSHVIIIEAYSQL